MWFRRAASAYSLYSATSNAKAAWEKRHTNPSDAAGHGVGAVTAAAGFAISTVGQSPAVASAIRVVTATAAQHTHGMVREGAGPYVQRRVTEVVDAARATAAKFKPPVGD